MSYTAKLKISVARKATAFSEDKEAACFVTKHGAQRRKDTEMVRTSMAQLLRQGTSATLNYGMHKHLYAVFCRHGRYDMGHDVQALKWNLTIGPLLGHLADATMTLRVYGHN